jgi:hypothetical protein
MEIAICEFGIDFHERFIEECIEYVFSMWKTSWAANSRDRVKFKKSPHHNFIIKMIVYYGIRNVVLWANTVEPYIYNHYKQFITAVDSKVRNKQRRAEFEKIVKEARKTRGDANYESSGIINLLASSVDGDAWIPNEAKIRYQQFLSAMLKLFDGEYIRGKIRAPSDLLPVGHTIKNVARFWHLSNPEWTTDANYSLEVAGGKENDIIIGYDEKSKTGLISHFKLRSPVQAIKKYKDIRLIERGTAAISRQKPFLINIAKKLGIKSVNFEVMASSQLADEIRAKLIFNEIRERVLGTKIKWFYFYYEKKPLIK